MGGGGREDKNKPINHAQFFHQAATGLWRPQQGVFKAYEKQRWLTLPSSAEYSSVVSFLSADPA